MVGNLGEREVSEGRKFSPKVWAGKVRKIVEKIKFLPSRLEGSGYRVGGSIHLSDDDIGVLPGSGGQLVVNGDESLAVATVRGVELYQRVLLLVQDDVVEVSGDNSLRMGWGKEALGVGFVLKWGLGKAPIVTLTRFFWIGGSSDL